jgi:hypothetical protein
MPARDLAAAAEQILAPGKTAGLGPVGAATRLGRAATEYRGLIAVTEDGEGYQNAVTRIIAGPFLLFDKAHDSASPELSYVREILSIEEGNVADADLTPPDSRSGTRLPDSGT